MVDSDPPLRRDKIRVLGVYYSSSDQTAQARVFFLRRSTKRSEWSGVSFPGDEGTGPKTEEAAQKPGLHWQKKPPFRDPPGPEKGDAKKPATANAVSIKRDAGRLPLRANPIQEHPPTTALREREREKTLGILESIFQTGSGDDDTLG